MFIIVTLLSIWLFMATNSFAQKRMQVSSNGFVTQVENREHAGNVIPKHDISSSALFSCSDRLAFGYPSDSFPCNLPFFGYHKDVFAEWFIVPVDGTIDSLCFLMSDQNNMKDSMVSIRIFESRIGPNSGPGRGSYHPPRSAWGYYVSTLDSDQQITPFRDKATDTNWVPTNQSQFPDDAPSFDPLGPEIWGSGGYKIKAHTNSINAIALDTLGKPHVHAGDSIFVTLQQQGDHIFSNSDGAATWCTSSTDLPNPAHNWKFYEHPSAGSQGWQARGEASWIWWLVMTVEGDLPPKFLSYTKLSHTLSTSAREVLAEIQDCFPIYPESALVATAYLDYSVNGITQPSIEMSHLDGDQWQVFIPNYPAGTLVQYTLRAIDSKGNESNTNTIRYRIVQLSNRYYSIDTVSSPSWIEIRSTGTKIPYWVVSRGTGDNATDEGSAGPFFLGDSFYFFDSTQRYVSIGVDGGLCLSNDSVQIVYFDPPSCPNFSWYGNQTFELPTPCLQHHVVLPFYNDFLLNPSSYEVAGSAYGSVYYERNGGKFIVEWDSAGYWGRNGGSTVSFEVVFNLDESSITFLYRDVQASGLDTTALIGLQADSSKRYFFLNARGSPSEVKPRDNWAITLRRGVGIAVVDGWNLLSVPGKIPDHRKAIIFPSATSPAWSYDGASYINADSIANGIGYWLKYDGNSEIGIVSSEQILQDTVIVRAGWNMIGSMSLPIDVTNIVSDPGGMTTSHFFGFTSGYHDISVIEPGQGYWVNVNQSGKLILSATPPAAFSASNQIRIVPTNETPPTTPTDADIHRSASHAPHRFSLEQNYPNPFNPVTELSFVIGHASFVTLRVYDVLGREVATIVNENLQPDEYTRKWDASNVSSGVYYYRLTAGTFADSKKLILLR